MRRRPASLAGLLAAAALGLGAAAPAHADDPDPGAQPSPPGPPSPPDLVLSGRNVRMTRGNVVGIRMGCRGLAVHVNEACIGSITLRLASAITVEVVPPRRPGQRRRPRPVMRRIPPFNFAVRDFTLNVGDAAYLRMRLSRRAAKLVRDQERLRVDVIGRYNSRAGASGSARRNVRFYFPKRPGV